MTTFEKIILKRDSICGFTKIHVDGMVMPESVPVIKGSTREEIGRADGFRKTEEGVVADLHLDKVKSGQSAAVSVKVDSAMSEGDVRHIVMSELLAVAIVPETETDTDPIVCGYLDDLRVFRIEDGETHWVVADLADEALQYHAIELGYDTADDYLKDANDVKCEPVLWSDSIRVRSDVDGSEVTMQAWEWALEGSGAFCSTNW